MTSTLTRRQLLADLPAAALIPKTVTETVTPIAADRFLDSVGANTHLEGGAYAANPALFATRIRQLGLRHLRDEVQSANAFDRWRALAETASLRFDLLVSPTKNTPQRLLEAIDTLGVANVAAVEGQNEGDFQWFRSQPAAGHDWVAAVVDYQHAIAQALRPAHPDLPLLSPTVLDYRPDDMARLRAAAPDCDIVALHAYAQHQQEPETDEPYAGLAWYRAHVAEPFKPAAPIMVTECGYSNNVGGVPTEISARYFPRLFLHNFAAGARRTYMYELLDEGRNRVDNEQNWGFLTSTLDPKPAFETMRLLLSTLADPGPTWSPKPAPFAVDSPATDLRHALFARRDGTLVAALWRAARSWNRDRRRVIHVPPAPTHITAPGRGAAETLRLSPGQLSPGQLSPDQSWTRQILAGGTVTLPIDDTVTLLRLS